MLQISIANIKRMWRTSVATPPTMSSANGTMENILTKKPTNFNITGGTGLLRCVDENDQIVYCSNCNFVAPMSVSYEHFIWLHEKYNCMVNSRGPCAYTISNTNSSGHNYVPNSPTTTNLIKLVDNDSTR
ncbi:orf44 [Trichoplusia ni single nucleopolyhedrovirus]|uniref:Orf44 n=1 Tax=Trichoplusia ni single nucleopolyhedrovirus TaxID=332054 RepID=Q462C1_9ABAC|nr:orf44 [Trichoplusia ni single nucleopolyhedrovirus]AAZ67415.1 orf44 [Trichoplusia ni single nucleopolyhedrovirus]